jgi:hypothetical protein
MFAEYKAQTGESVAQVMRLVWNILEARDTRITAVSGKLSARKTL